MRLLWPRVGPQRILREMAATFVLPLYPLEGQVLLPGRDVCVQDSPETATSIAAREREHHARFPRHRSRVRNAAARN